MLKLENCLDYYCIYEDVALDKDGKFKLRSGYTVPTEAIVNCGNDNGEPIDWEKAETEYLRGVDRAEFENYAKPIKLNTSNGIAYRTLFEAGYFAGHRYYRQECDLAEVDVSLLAHSLYLLDNSPNLLDNYYGNPPEAQGFYIMYSGEATVPFLKIRVCRGKPYYMWLCLDKLADLDWAEFTQTCIRSWWAKEVVKEFSVQLDKGEVSRLKKLLEDGERVRELYLDANGQVELGVLLAAVELRQDWTDFRKASCYIERMKLKWNYQEETDGN
jgi:hypothetical protein